MRMIPDPLRTLLSALAATGLVAGVAQAGPEEPPAPPPPGNPTMKSLNEIPASWHQILPADEDGDLFDVDLPCDSQRFRCEMPLGDGGEAVLDLETGLVWQREPEETILRDWRRAFDACVQATTGGRMGWRLPRVDELATLIDPSSFDLVADGPFDIVGDGLAPAHFWTASKDPEDPARAYSVYFGDGDGPDRTIRSLVLRVWCVRGATGAADPE